jgi:hypothetical protein
MCWEEAIEVTHRVLLDTSLMGKDGLNVFNLQLFTVIYHHDWIQSRQLHMEEYNNQTADVRQRKGL